MIKLSDIKPLTRWDLREQIERCYNLAVYFNEECQPGNAAGMLQKAHYLEKLLEATPPQ